MYQNDLVAWISSAPVSKWSSSMTGKHFQHQPKQSILNLWQENETLSMINQMHIML